MPDVGEGLIEADIVEWKVAPGDVVTLNQALVDIETAKATVELPSPYAGTVATLHGAAGDTIHVGEPLITFDVGDERSGLDGSRESEGESVGGRREPVLIGYGVAEDEPVRRVRRRPGAHDAATSPVDSTPPESARGPVRTTPPVRLLAKQQGVDLAALTGTGPHGLVTRDDVRRAHSTSRSANERGPSPLPPAPSRFVGREIASWSQGPREERIAVKGVLKSMADAMVQSSTLQPQAAVWLRVDATKTMELLGGLKNHPSFAGLRLSPLTIVALAVCDAARHYPGINSSFDDQNKEVVVRRYVNLGIAADTPRGLLVPNIKDADRLDLVGMAGALAQLVDAARRNIVAPSDMLGTTLTITNVGPFGVDAAIAILPPGTGAIVCVGKVAPAPWVVDDAVVVRHVAEVAMTFDHRQIDGALASAVVAHIGRFLEDPAPSLLAR